MRLTVHTDYTLRVLIYLTLKYRSGEKSTIPEIAGAYGISRNHLMKIIHELAQGGFIETAQGRSGGAWLARAPTSISVGDVVRFSEPDFAIVECHVAGQESDCAVWEACNLKRGFRRALDAFMSELDRMTLDDAVARSRAALQLGVDKRGRRVIPIAAPSATEVPAASRRPSRVRASTAATSDAKPSAVPRAVRMKAGLTR